MTDDTRRTAAARLREMVESLEQARESLVTGREVGNAIAALDSVLARLRRPRLLDDLVATQAAELARLRTALEAAAQFIRPEIARGPAVDGWKNTIDMVEAVIGSPEDR